MVHYWGLGPDLIFHSGQLYVSGYFQPEARLQMEALVAEVKEALHARIESLT
jgi:predicted metalloendopeptidase